MPPKAAQEEQPGEEAAVVDPATVRRGAEQLAWRALEQCRRADATVRAAEQSIDFLTASSKTLAGEREVLLTAVEAREKAYGRGREQTLSPLSPRADQEPSRPLPAKVAEELRHIDDKLRELTETLDSSEEALQAAAQALHAARATAAQLRAHHEALSVFAAGADKGAPISELLTFLETGAVDPVPCRSLVAESLKQTTELTGLAEQNSQLARQAKTLAHTAFQHALAPPSRWESWARSPRSADPSLRPGGRCQGAAAVGPRPGGAPGQAEAAASWQVT